MGIKRGQNYCKQKLEDLKQDMRQSMYCHDCGQNFSVDVNVDLDGNHVFNCPHCDHEHCRVIKNGVVTGDRWAQRNGNTYTASTFISSSTVTAFYTTSSFLQDAWSGTMTATAYY